MGKAVGRSKTVEDGQGRSRTVRRSLPSDRWEGMGSGGGPSGWGVGMGGTVGEGVGIGNDQLGLWYG